MKDKRVWALSFPRLNQLRKNHVEQARQHDHYRYLYDYYPNKRLQRNWSNIETWFQAHGIATVVHTVTKDTPRSRKQIGVSCGIVAARVLTSAMLYFDEFTRHPVHEAVSSSVLRAANTELAAAGHVPSSYTNTTKT